MSSASGAGEEEFDAAQLAELTTQSTLEMHRRGECHSCAFFVFKADGCRKGQDCAYCHFCNRDQFKRKKITSRKNRRAVLQRAGMSGQTSPGPVKGKRPQEDMEEQEEDGSLESTDTSKVPETGAALPAADAVAQCSTATAQGLGETASLSRFQYLYDGGFQERNTFIHFDCSVDCAEEEGRPRRASCPAISSPPPEELEGSRAPPTPRSSADQRHPSTSFKLPLLQLSSKLEREGSCDNSSTAFGDCGASTCSARSVDE